ncbi:nuclear transport factor 2 family protein [Erwinia persicina]|uniref:nuclear transport factor 2 family protein n=1 Tax=Erwinia persicina TaxID=55211 RepID=UPI001781C7F0|nr:DUF4440 domain-containing protein [Erwinia persicina]MBD8161570.1 DUF4440 domain-containing protein [Erwinia persicina]MBD8212989.1 DUF4440 domain-containing protein [Erwinia persicina]
MTDLSELLLVLQRLEIQLHQPAIRHDAQQVNALLHQDFTETGRSGIRYSRQQVIDALAKERDRTAIEAGDFTLTMLADGVVLLNYISTQRDATGITANRTMRTSIWIWSAKVGHWQMRFHQGTPAKD